jgi:non-ribosomal peptide synthetase component F
MLFHHLREPHSGVDIEQLVVHLPFMLADAAPSVVITTETLKRRLGDTSAAIICLNADAAELERQSDINPGVVIPPDAAAYVIYTSGSKFAAKLACDGRRVPRFSGTKAAPSGGLCGVGT